VQCCRRVNENSRVKRASSGTYSWPHLSLHLHFRGPFQFYGESHLSLLSPLLPSRRSLHRRVKNGRLIHSPRSAWLRKPSLLARRLAAQQCGSFPSIPIRQLRHAQDPCELTPSASLDGEETLELKTCQRFVVLLPVLVSYIQVAETAFRLALKAAATLTATFRSTCPKTCPQHIP
jgi:hypothetical protein